MLGKTQSILLQVAFKEAVSSLVAQGIFAEEEVSARTEAFFATLVKLHEKLGIDSDETGAKGGGNWQRNSAPAARAPKALPEGVTVFTDSDGISWNDYRDAKRKGAVVSGFPEFKTTDNKTSVWIYKQDGSPDERAVALIAAADAMKSLVDPA